MHVYILQTLFLCKTLDFSWLTINGKEIQFRLKELEDSFQWIVTFVSSFIIKVSGTWTETRPGLSPRHIFSSISIVWLSPVMKEFFLSCVEEISSSLPISHHLPPFCFPYFSSASFQGIPKICLNIFLQQMWGKNSREIRFKKERLFPDFWGG